MSEVINGIQQIGIGVENLQESWKWYREIFGMDIRIFEDKAQANFMTKYTGGKVATRSAVLAMNLQSGGGFEIWQYESKKPQKAIKKPQIGDYGIFAVKMKCRNLKATYNFFKSKAVNIVTEITKNPLENSSSFFVEDPYGNLFQMIEDKYWLTDTKHPTGGVAGVIIGVSNIDKALKLYSEVLEYETLEYDKEDIFEDLTSLEGGANKVRRTLLKHQKFREGAFSYLLGYTQIEMIELKEGNKPRRIYEGRNWGDLGFIHVCFDVSDMTNLKDRCEKKGFPFTVDSADKFDMGQAGGHFSYIEDPDETLIEFVQIHKVPILKKFGWYVNLNQKNTSKRLPKWQIKFLRFNKIK